MATATFNRQIYSSSNFNYTYILDDVITKDFNEPYTYSFDLEPPQGTEINGNILTVPINTSFDLNLLVGGYEGKAYVEVTVSTTVIILGEATFNTPILSSNSDEVNTYNLDEVIDKNFDGPYTYSFDKSPPLGVEIINNLLNVPPNVSSSIVILVSAQDGTTEARSVGSIFREGVATFNTPILSSNSDEVNTYNLDEVIDKNFLGNYNYSFPQNLILPEGVSIVFDPIGLTNTLIIPPNVEFELSVFVVGGTKMSRSLGMASTSVLIESTNPFDKAKNDFFGNPETQQNLGVIRQSWSSIINRQTDYQQIIN